MAKKIIITESMAKRLFGEKVLKEADMSKDEIKKIAKDAAKDAVKNDRDINKDMEKKIKALVAACVNKLFMTLWKSRNFYEDEIKK